MSSPFALRLGTNYCPTDQEVLEILSLLVEPTLRIKSLDDEIADLQRSIDRLVEERKGLRSYVEAHRALISPFRRLPLDVIQAIFIACMPTHRNCVMSATEAPILLGRICSAWRAISIATPRLWSSLHVVEPQKPSAWPTPYKFDAVYNDKVVQRLETTQTWLGRSGQCPLSISLHGAIDYDNDPSATVQFVQALTPFAARWQHIHFWVPPSVIFDMVSHIDIDMPELESIAFYCDVDPFPNAGCGSFGMLQGARITSFSVPACLFTRGRWPVPWNQLTILTIGGPETRGCTSEMVLPIISMCLQLRSCELLLDTLSGTSTVESLIVELPFLHTLAIRCNSSVSPAVSILLNHLSLPELRNFTLFGYFEEGLYRTTLLGFFMRSTRLESFQINSKIFPLSFLHEIFRSLPPTMRHLSLRDIRLSGAPQRVDIDDATLEVLATPGLFPALHHLAIEQGHSISDATVLRFITARMLEFKPLLRRVEIKFDRAMTVDIMPSLRQFLDTGLAVSLDYLAPWTPNFSPWDGLDDNPGTDLWSRRPIRYW
ncbi:F-box domain-containing protein [Mycena sanguinolenta]|uniref:F-box domain-containing protein n=1 Tax=Mycena sanguinolenta TaxID=230812 RepID=A0A8H6ZA10_9AGAR|nr:F-box domain-containing protein [Mycena sanguinolenta]